MFVPNHTHYNVQCMQTGETFLTHLDDLAEAMESSNPMRRKPYNEVAWNEVRLFFELDGTIPSDLEVTAFVGLRLFTRWREGRPFDDAKSSFTKDKVVLRSSSKGEERFHVIHPNVVLPVKEYSDLITHLQTFYPQLDKTCNANKAWLRFPRAPKRDSARVYHLPTGVPRKASVYRNAFINASSVPAKAVRVSTRGIVGGKDADLIRKALGLEVRKICYVGDGRRTYFTKGKARCVCGTEHTKRPVTVHVIFNEVKLGACYDPQCKTTPVYVSP